MRYPFTMVQMENQEAIIEWGGWDLKTQTSINVFQRRIVAGEKIIRREANQQWIYTIKDIKAIIQCMISVAVFGWGTLPN